jgi:hypothetical protein
MKAGWVFAAAAAVFAVSGLASFAAVSAGASDGVTVVRKIDPAGLMIERESPDGSGLLTVGVVGRRTIGERRSETWSRVTVSRGPDTVTEFGLYSSFYPTWREFGAVRWADGAPTASYRFADGTIQDFAITVSSQVE